MRSNIVARTLSFSNMQVLVTIHIFLCHLEFYSSIVCRHFYEFHMQRKCILDSLAMAKDTSQP